MRILSRYVLRQLVGPFVFALSALTFLMLLNELAKQFKKLVGKGLGWHVVAEVFVYSVPFLLALIVPMAVLVAVLYAFNRLASDNEITAMKASGVSLGRITLPVLVAAAAVAGTMIWFNDTVLPEANHHLAQLRSSIARKTPTLALRERSVNEVIPKKLFLRAARIDPATSRLEDVTIWDARDPDLTRTIWADSGRMGLNAAQTDLYLTLRDGKLLERDAENRTEIQEVWFDTDYLRVPGIGNELERQDSRIRGDRELPIDSMQARARTSDSAAAYGARVSREAAVAWTARLLGGLTPDTLPPDSSAAALEGWRNGRSVVTPAGAENTFRTQALIVERHREDENAYRVEIQKKISIPAACVVFVLIGAPVATRYRRAGVALVVGMSLAVFCLYYVALIGGEHLADKRLLSPAWAMWAPNVLFGAIGIGAFLHSRRAGG